MKRKRLIVLGATGSIGRSAAKVARDIPEYCEIVGMAANGNALELATLANELRPQRLCLANASKLNDLRNALHYSPEVLSGPEGLIDLAAGGDADMVLVAIVGTQGLAPALAALEAGRDLAVASKEILVMAGEAVTSAASRKALNLLPVDSEHNAIFQCLAGHGGAEAVRRLILTASGGPFRTWPNERILQATPSEALQHPTWSMGRKISIDSATLFNKGLEMIEAHWLFGVPMSKVDVVVHPQSIVHSMVEFIDRSVLAQLSHSDMCFPIQYAITWPERVESSLAPLDLAELARLEFERPRYEDFPALGIARTAGEAGGTLPAVMNAANEVAVDAFLDGRIGFPGIWRIVETVCANHKNITHPKLDDILAADAWAREEAASQFAA